MNTFLRFALLVCGLVLMCPKWHLMGLPFWPDMICFVFGAGLVFTTTFFWTKK